MHNMVAHLDAVTSLSIDPSGLFVLSGSKCKILLDIFTAKKNGMIVEITDGELEKWFW